MATNKAELRFRLFFARTAAASAVRRHRSVGTWPILPDGFRALTGGEARRLRRCGILRIIDKIFRSVARNLRPFFMFSSARHHAICWSAQ
jgi:hypothetical protein